MTGSGNVLAAGGALACILVGAGYITLSDSHILGGGERVISSTCTLEVKHVDLRNNYWGYETEEEIATSILDWTDDPDRCRIVDFEPFYPRPVENEDRSWGAVKSLFR